MEKTLPQPESSKDDKLDSKAERIKENLMKLEKSVISEVDEGSLAMRAGFAALGFGMTPATATADDDDEE